MLFNNEREFINTYYYSSLVHNKVLYAQLIIRKENNLKKN